MEALEKPQDGSVGANLCDSHRRAERTDGADPRTDDHFSHAEGLRRISGTVREASGSSSPDSSGRADGSHSGRDNTHQQPASEPVRQSMNNGQRPISIARWLAYTLH